jgi:hypothetical protein
MFFHAFAAVLITWVVLDYKVAFESHMLPFAGVPDPLSE